MERLKALYQKYEELILYFIFGVCTTLVYFVTRFGMRALGVPPDGSVIIAQVVAITFSFIVSKLFVFKSKTRTVKALLREALSFYAARGLSFLVDIGITHFCVQTYSSWFISVLHLDKLPFDSALFQIPLVQKFVGTPELANEFLFAFLAQVIILIANYLFSKLVVFRKKNGRKSRPCCINMYIPTASVQSYS